MSYPNLTALYTVILTPVTLKSNLMYDTQFRFLLLMEIPRQLPSMQHHFMALYFIQPSRQHWHFSNLVFLYPIIFGCEHFIRLQLRVQPGVSL